MKKSLHFSVPLPVLSLGAISLGAFWELGAQLWQAWSDTHFWLPQSWDETPMRLSAVADPLSRGDPLAGSGWQADRGEAGGESKTLAHLNGDPDGFHDHLLVSWDDAFDDVQYL